MYLHLYNLIPGEKGDNRFAERVIGLNCHALTTLQAFYATASSSIWGDAPHGEWCAVRRGALSSGTILAIAFKGISSLGWVGAYKTGERSQTQWSEIALRLTRSRSLP